MDSKLRIVRPDPFYPDAKRPTVFREGIEYQDFVCTELAKRHIILQNFSSKKYQFDVGENLQGFEIKLDNLCTQTHRLSIETAERSRKEIPNFTPSGIYRDDNSWLYIHGNYECIFVFAKNFLRALHRSGRYPEHEIDTIRKFYLPWDDARKYAATFIDLTDVPF